MKMKQDHFPMEIKWDDFPQERKVGLFSQADKVGLFFQVDKVGLFSQGNKVGLLPGRTVKITQVKNETLNLYNYSPETPNNASEQLLKYLNSQKQNALFITGIVKGFWQQQKIRSFAEK